MRRRPLAAMLALLSAALLLGGNALLDAGWGSALRSIADRVLPNVSATVKTTILTNAQQPIMPTQSRHLRQRIFTISTNAGAYASIDERTMLSGGAGRGG